MKFLGVAFLILLFANCVFPCTINISKIKAKAIYGIVIDETEFPIADAKIQIYKNSDDDKILAESITNENGRFEIKNFPAGKYLIRAKAENFAYTTSFLKLKKSSSKIIDREMIFTLVPSIDCTGWVEMKKIQKSKKWQRKKQKH